MLYTLNGSSFEFQNVIPHSLHAYNSFFGIEDNEVIGEDIKSIKTVTFQVTENCNLACTYCYQINKSTKVMSFDIAKKFVDLLIADSYKDDTYFSINKTRGIICEFIGGEPLLEIELMDKIIDYFRGKLIELKHPWIPYFRVSMISNGVLYKTKEFQEFLNKNKGILSFGISLDGCKRLHDACRIFPDGSGSYDLAVEGCLDYLKINPDMGTKMTFAPENIEYAYEAALNLINLGYKTIHCNPIYEDKWTDEHPKIYYEQLKKIADYLLDNDLYDHIFFRPFEYTVGKTIDLSMDNKNYCGSTGHMLACDYKGNIYPCVRFMKSSLGEDVTPFKIGDVYNGINVVPQDKERVNLLDSITLTSQSDNECINCKIASGCGWCTAYNYQVTGTPNKRVKSICGMHKARVLANVYYWNKVYKKGGYDNEPYLMNMPKEWALEIINEDEYNMLIELTKFKDA